MSKIVLPFFFGKLEIIGEQNIPLNNPYILAPNHQNSFIDAVVLGAFSPKPITFLARSDAFVSPYDRLLHALNMLPVYRMRDGFEKLKLNEITFAKTDQVLAANNPVLIFPESNTNLEHHIRPLTKGIARMAFQAQSKTERDLYILPVGINYGHHLYPFHRLFIHYGTPISVNDFTQLHSEQPAKALIRLRNAISDGLRDVMLMPEKDKDTPQKLKVLDRHYENQDFDAIKNLLKNPNDLTGEKYYPLLKPLMWLLTLPHAIPFLILYKLLGDLKDPQFILSYKFITALLLIPLWWTIITLSMTIGFGWKMGLTALIISVSSLFARQYLQKRIR